MPGTLIKKLSFYAGLVVLSGCVETYEAPKTLDDVDVLVIDGFLNATNRSVVVNISHAQSLSSSEPPVVEARATVDIHADDGSHVVLNETSAGTYSRDNLNIDPKRKYQLRVTTAKGHQYQSDYVDVRLAPPITTVTIEPRDDHSALDVLLSSKDPKSETRYYRWDFMETWEYTATFRSDFILINKSPTPRAPGEGVYRCYRTRPSTKILVGTSIQLSEDVINDQLIMSIPTGDQRTYVRYSIEVQQRSVTRDEFDYLKQLQQSTENLGGLFDPLPSQLYGNVRHVGDNAVPVLGYFSAGSTQKARSFYDHEDLPHPMKILPLAGKCSQDTICVVIPSPHGLKCHAELKTMKGTEVITGTLFKEFETIGFLASTVECADCRSQGGVTTRPDFW
jgi:hypothetical protein